MKSSSALYVKTIAEIAKILPRKDGEIGLTERYALDWIHSHGIKKTANGWSMKSIKQAIKEDMEKRRPKDSLDQQIKLRKIRLLDIEIGKLDKSLIDKPDHVKQLLAMQAVCLSIIDQWIANVSAKRADAALLDDLRKCRDSALSEIQAIRGDE